MNAYFPIRNECVLLLFLGKKWCVCLGICVSKEDEVGCTGRRYSESKFLQGKCIEEKIVIYFKILR